MANGHSPDRPPKQGDMGPVHTSQPRTSGTPGKSEPAKSTIARGIRTPGVGANRKTF